MFGRRSLAAAAAVLVGLLAGYWHFAELLERPAPGETVTRPASEDGPVPIDSAPSGGTETAETTGTAPDTLESDGEPSVAQPAATLTPEGESAEAQAPTFDVLRVEADGSAVIAGRGAPGAAIRVMRGLEEIARETVNEAGEFAIALNDPLPVGDHQITLEAGDGAAAVSSAQTAVVSIPPRGREAELLVMIEEPNRPARLVEAPTTAADAAVQAAAIVAVPPVPTMTAGAGAGAGEGEVEPGESQVAAVADPDPAPSIPATTPEQASSPLAIGAIEIEGDRLYVAGAAKPNARVRLYVDDAFVAEAKGGAQSEFFASARVDVPVGSHVVRADEIDANGSVSARVEVPFDRIDDRPMSAVAAAPDATTPRTEDEAEGQVEIAAAPTPPIPPVNFQPDAADDVAGDRPSSRSSATTAPSPPAPDLQPRADRRTASETASTRGEDRLASHTPETAEPMPAMAAAQVERSAAQPDEPRTRPGEPATPRAPMPEAERAPSPDVAAEPSAPTIGATAASPPLQPAPPSAEPPRPLPAAPTVVVRQAALQPVEGRVLIRRGDSLWRISRNTYGRGSRYTVIYLANGDQIRDPDLIYPGQIFRMPEDTAAN